MPNLAPIRLNRQQRRMLKFKQAGYEKLEKNLKNYNQRKIAESKKKEI